MNGSASSGEVMTHTSNPSKGLRSAQACYDQDQGNFLAVRQYQGRLPPEPLFDPLDEGHPVIGGIASPAVLDADRQLSAITLHHYRRVLRRPVPRAWIAVTEPTADYKGTKIDSPIFTKARSKCLMASIFP